MYTARTTEIGKLRQYERELTAQYGEAVLRRRFQEARSLWDRRHTLRRAILQHQEWHVKGFDDVAVALPRDAAVAEELARAA